MWISLTFSWHSSWHAWLTFSCELSLLTQITGWVVPNLLMQKGNVSKSWATSCLLAFRVACCEAYWLNVMNTQLVISNRLSVAQLATVIICKTYLYTVKVGVRLYHPPYTWLFISKFNWLLVLISCVESVFHLRHLVKLLRAFTFKRPEKWDLGQDPLLLALPDWVQ